MMPADLQSFLLLLLIAAIIGSIGQAIAGYSTPGCALSIVIGFVGTIIGRMLYFNFGLPEYLPIKVAGRTFPIVWSVIGAVGLVLVLRLISRLTSGRRAPIVD